MNLPDFQSFQEVENYIQKKAEERLDRASKIEVAKNEYEKERTK